MGENRMVKLSDNEKEEHLVKLFKEYVYEEEESHINELDKEESKGYYSKYCDVDIEEIVSFSFNLFDECETKKDLEQKMTEFLGYYSGNELFKQDGMNYLYIQV